MRILKIIIINKKFLEFFMCFSSCVFLLRASYPHRATCVGGSEWSQRGELAGLRTQQNRPLHSEQHKLPRATQSPRKDTSATSHYSSFPSFWSPTFLFLPDPEDTAKLSQHTATGSSCCQLWNESFQVTCQLISAEATAPSRDCQFSN